MTLFRCATFPLLTKLVQLFFGVSSFTWFSSATSSSSFRIMMIMSFVAAAASTTNYNAYQYDMTTPQFTPDGRLLQVEYASQAAQRSAPILVAQWKLGSSSDVGSKTTHDEFDACVLVLMTLRHQALQERLIVLPSASISGGQQPSTSVTTAASNSHAQFSSSSSSSSVVIALSGILADSVALLQQLYQTILDKRRQFGWDDDADCSSNSGIGTTKSSLSYAHSALYLAHTIAGYCQQHAFGGGIRPYGATLLVCDVDVASGGKKNALPFSLWQTDPSGAVTNVLAAAATTSSTTSSANDYSDRNDGWVLVLGGNSYQGPSTDTATTTNSPGVGTTSLQRKLQSKWASILQQQRKRQQSKQKQSIDSAGGVTPVLSQLAKLFLEETTGTKLSSLLSPSNLYKNDDNNRKRHSRGRGRRAAENEDTSTSPPPPSSSFPLLEIVVLHSRHGAYKLTPQQIRRLLLISSSL